MSNYTPNTLPNNIPALRSGTTNDGRMLIHVGADPRQQQSALRDLRERLPAGWTATIYKPTGIDIVITHEENR